MTADNTPNSNRPSQPYRPQVRGANHYADINKDITASVQAIDSKELFNIHIKAINKGGTMETPSQSEPTPDDNRFLLNMIFKPHEPGLRLRPGEIQLLLAYIGDLLQEIEEEEKKIIEEEGNAENRTV
jgi:hypothetical protein